MQGGQMYSLNPSTGLYEVAKNPGVMSVQTSSQPTTSVQSGLLSVPNNSNNPPTVQGQSPVDTSYAGLLQQLVSKTQMSPEELELNQRLADLKRARAEAIGNEQMMPETNAYQTGRIGIIENVNNAQQANVAQQAQNLATQRQVAGDVLKSAAGLAAPVITGFSNQAFNPQTGEFSGGTSLQSAVQNVVQKLQSGQMTYNDAVAALSGYGQGGVNALQQALPQGFNIAQSNTLAGQQGSVGVNYQLADAALKNVESIIQKLAPAQTTNIPIINRAANWISTQFGVNSDQTRAMTGAVQSLRNAYASLLASAKGGTPTDYSSQAAAEIPNEPTPNDIAAIRHNLKPFLIDFLFAFQFYPLPAFLDIRPFQSKHHSPCCQNN